jgi:hypothetical protein
MNMSKLDGVNRILRAAKEHPVAVLGSSTENDSLMAEELLDEVSKREQMTGLHCNTIDQEFTPDSNNSNKIVLPSNTLQVVAAYTNADRHFMHREVDGVTYLFDSEPAEDVESDEFDNDTSVWVRITTLLDFDQLPLHHQFSIADQAAQEYQQAVLGSTTLDQALTQRAMRSRAIARAYDMRTRPANQFTHGRSTGAARGTRYTPRGWYG